MQEEEGSKLSLPTGGKRNSHIYSCYNSYSCQRGEWIIFSYKNHRCGTIRPGRKTLLLCSESHTLCFLILFSVQTGLLTHAHKETQRALPRLD